ncbi:hypothetical protein Patl1_06252 [Pistacia atlantica]|uniref:Uncharacterized protein n=1 Tax=Pistacia atlantica TaxID=434234 RepID=A0ACC1BWP3_9ROSI|nr:hypothetical protein Patl1_06252 [Pistacia atlantica]
MLLYNHHVAPTLFIFSLHYIYIYIFSFSLHRSITYLHARRSLLSFFLLRFIMGDSSGSYIHMVQHLIEKCLIFRMTKEECMEALSKHADIKPVITSTAYAQSHSKEDRMSEEETSQMIQKMITDSSKAADEEEDDDN